MVEGMPCTASSFPPLWPPHARNMGQCLYGVAALGLTAPYMYVGLTAPYIYVGLTAPYMYVGLTAPYMYVGLTAPGQ